ncbi:MAG: hypothetical protein ACYDEQ_15645, partial [Desulfocucumaceae bacterium]
AAKTGFSDAEFDTGFMIMFLHEACTDGVIKEACRITKELVIIDYARILIGWRRKLVGLVEKDKFHRFSGINLTTKLAGYGFSLSESRRINPSLYIYFFTKGRAPRTGGGL